MSDLKHLFEKNLEWSNGIRKDDPDFFQRLSQLQAPEYLWIGCSDSRVPANQIAGLLPGEVFVHRNIANQVVHSDLNCLSVLQYGVDALRVKHILVVGHYGCGGVKAAHGNLRLGLVDNWLRHVQDVRHQHRAWLDEVTPDEQVNALVELNVLEQARNVCTTTVVQDAWARGQAVVVHGWVYGLHNGLLEDLKMTASAAADLDQAYATALAGIHARYRMEAA